MREYMVYIWLAFLSLYFIWLHLRISKLQVKVIGELQNIATINREMTEILRREANKNK